MIRFKGLANHVINISLESTEAFNPIILYISILLFSLFNPIKTNCFFLDNFFSVNAITLKLSDF